MWNLFEFQCFSFDEESHGKVTQSREGMKCMTHVCSANLSLPPSLLEQTHLSGGTQVSLHHTYISTVISYTRQPYTYAPWYPPPCKFTHILTSGDIQQRVHSREQRTAQWRLPVEACLSVSVVTSVTLILILSKRTLWQVMLWRHREPSVGWLSKHVLWFVGLCSLSFPRKPSIPGIPMAYSNWLATGDIWATNHIVCPQN